MPIVDINGREIKTYRPDERDLNWPIVTFLDSFFEDKKILMPDFTATFSEIEIAMSKFQVDCALLENASHAVDIKNSARFTAPIYYLSSNMEYFYQEQDNVIFFPFWLFALRIFPKNNIIIGSVGDLERKYQFSTANRNLKFRPHRIYFLGKLLQKKYWNKICSRMHKFDDFDCNYVDFHDVGLTEDEFKLVKDNYDKSPYWSEGEFNAVIDTNFEIFTDAYINLVTETYIYSDFLSEKSYKPLMSGQIPMIFGCCNIVRMYADLGFDMFYDIIDHNQYDGVHDWRQRINAMLECLDHVVTYPMYDIFTSTMARRQKNLDFLYSEQLLNTITAPLIKKINSL
jgi:hypothetical protein